MQALLELHLAALRASSPPGSVYALDLSGLQASSVALWTVWAGNALIAMGALKELAADHGEIKSMRTHPAHLRKGAASAMLEHLINTAKARRYRRLSLETGSGPAFEPALALYRGRGFVNGPVFSDYAPSSFNQFLHLAL
jgi:putative acetyltransferase